MISTILQHSLLSPLEMVIADVSSVMLRVSNVQKHCVYFNKAWLTFRGKTLEEELKEQWFQAIHADDYDIYMHTVHSAFEKRNTFSVEYRLRKSDGSFGWIQEDGSPYCDNNGEFQGYVNSCVDITQAKVMIETLEEQRRELEKINLRLTESTKVARIAIWEWDIINDALIWDSQMFSMYGISENTHTSTVDLWKNALHPDDKASTLRTLGKTMRGSGAFSAEFRIIQPSGEMKYIKADATVIKDEKGDVISMLGTNLDITQSKISENEIRRLKKRNQVLLDYSPVCHKIVDLDFKLRYMNANGFRMLSLPGDDSHYGQPYPFSFFPDEAKIQMIEKLTSVKLNKKREVFEATTEDSKGNEIWLLHTIIPVFTDDQTALDYLTVVSADITQQKITQEQLHQREKMDAVGQLAAGVAHDFNNQLASMSGYAQLLEMESTSDRTRMFATKIIETAERSSNLTKQMLSFSRKQKLVVEPVDVHDELKNTIDLLSHSIDKRVEVKTALNANVTRISADKSQIQSSFLNLAINAAHAMPNGGQILISTINVNADSEDFLLGQSQVSTSEFVKVSFKDNGVGIATQYLNKVFEPFFTTKAPGEGTGMGLASVYGTIKNHSGFINVESELGKGACFHIYLPLCTAAYQSEIENSVEGAFSHCEHTPKTVLVVDDEEDLRQVLKDALITFGYTVITAVNGKEGVELFRLNRNLIDIVLLDMAMPVMNGADAFKAIRRIDPNAKVLIASGYDAASSSITLESEGTVKFIEKPFNLHALKSLLSQLVSA